MLPSDQPWSLAICRCRSIGADKRPLREIHTISPATNFPIRFRRRIFELKRKLAASFAIVFEIAIELKLKFEFFSCSRRLVSFVFWGRVFSNVAINFDWLTMARDGFVFARAVSWIIWQMFHSRIGAFKAATLCPNNNSRNTNSGQSKTTAKFFVVNLRSCFKNTAEKTLIWKIFEN